MSAIDEPVTIGDGTIVDGSVWTQVLGLRVVRDMTESGTDIVGSANEFEQTIQTTIPGPTNSPASYEKAALIVMMETADPSAEGILRDAVGIDMRGQIAAGNRAGRAWGGISEAKILAGGDGLLVAHECEVENYGTPQPLVDQTDTKMALHITSVGRNYATAGIVYDGLFYNGIILRGCVECGLSIRDAPVAVRIEGALPILEFRETGQGMWRVQAEGSAVKIIQNTAEAGDFSTVNENLRLEDPKEDTSVGFLVLCNNGGVKTVKRVSQGAADTGDPGHRVLQVPN